MEYNPYAAPRSALDAGAPGPYGSGAPQPWEIDEVLRAAWSAFKQNWLVLVFSTLTIGVLLGAPSIGLSVYMTTQHLAPESIEMQSASLVLAVLVLVVYPFFGTGFMRIMLAAARGESPEFGLLFSGGDRYVKLLGLRAIFQVPALALSLTVLGAGVLGVAPLVLVARLTSYAFAFVLGIASMLGLYYADFFVVDADLGPIDALKESWTRSANDRGKLFLFALVCGLLFAGASLCCGLPVLLAAPTILTATAIVFLRMSGRIASTPPAEMGG